MQTIDELERQAMSEVEGAQSTGDLRALEIKYLGKSGLYTGLMRGIAQLPAEERPQFGQKVNQAKDRLQSEIDGRSQRLLAEERQVQFQAEAIDVTMPGRPVRLGNEHVLQQAMNRVKQVFSGLGFTYEEFPELEEFQYNFQSLNYPPDHPAMDDQDTFYIDDDHLLRTQTTAFQGRLLERIKPPFRRFTIGRCFRNEAVDRTHGHTFHQVDCFMVDEGISLADLKGTLGLFARAMFGEEVRIRFRPDFFPFVEPGVDYAISTPKFGNGRWLELGGAGMIHPNILEAYGIDTERYSGFAFGLGIERIPMLAYGVDDLRLFYENDLRFLRQFVG